MKSFHTPCVALCFLLLTSPLYAATDSASLRHAAEAGSAEAEVDLAMAYHEGTLGLPQSDAQAVAWFTRAAKQGDLEGEYNLAIAYYHGYGVPKDLTQAVAWFKKAAEQGLADAQYILASAYQNGVGGLPKDKVQSDMWLALAEAQGNKDAARERIELEGTMSEDELVAAKLLITSHSAQMTPRPDN